MSYWLGSRIAEDHPDWNPSFALQSALNWPKALSFEILKEHGVTPKEQAESCEKWFTGRTEEKRTAVSYALVFAPLFHSLAFSTSLKSLCESHTDRPWMYPSAIVSWYYSFYHATLSMLAANDGNAPATHAKTINAFNAIRDKMPHPLNMVAKRTTGESYEPILPNYPSASRYSLSRRFDQKRSVAQGMLLEYLHGSAKHRVDEVKEDLLKERKKEFSDFRSKSARKARDDRLPDRINFMNCAFRYRGKANYRDSLFLVYGRHDARFDSTFIEALCSSACFAFVCAVTFVKVRLGGEPVSDFLRDVDENFRDHEVASPQVRFWASLKGVLY